MKHITVVLILIFVISSCKNSPVDIRKEAIESTNEILSKAKAEGVGYYKSKGLKSFNMMDSFNYKLVISELAERSALLWYEADVVSLLSPDCLVKPSEIVSDEKKKNQAIKDSIYHSVLVEKMSELKNMDRINYFDHMDFFVYFEELKAISNELRSYCTDEFNGNLDEMIKKKW